MEGVLASVEVVEGEAELESLFPSGAILYHASSQSKALNLGSNTYSTAKDENHILLNWIMMNTIDIHLLRR